MDKNERIVILRQQVAALKTISLTLAENQLYLLEEFDRLNTSLGIEIERQDASPANHERRQQLIDVVRIIDDTFQRTPQG